MNKQISFLKKQLQSKQYLCSWFHASKEFSFAFILLSVRLPNAYDAFYILNTGSHDNKFLDNLKNMHFAYLGSHDNKFA